MSVDKWNPENAALTHAARDADTLLKFYSEQHAVEKVIREHAAQVGEVCETIGRDDPDSLVRRVKELYLAKHPFNGRDDYLLFLTGTCLTLAKNSEAVSDEPELEYITATAKVECTYGEYRAWNRGIFSIPADLGSAFGVQSLPWLSSRCETVVRELAARVREARYPPDGNFAFTVDPESRSVELEQGSIRLVLAPDEDSIARSVKAAKMGSDSRDHWDALARATAMLLRYRQPLGDALSDWVADALVGRETIPDGRKSAQWPRNKLRDITITEAIRALVRCGMRAMTSDRSPGSACEAVAEAFSLSETTVLDIWKATSR